MLALPNSRREFRYRVFGPGKSGSVHRVEMSRTPTVAEIKAALRPHLEGGTPEHVIVLLDGRPADMFVDEMATAKGLPRNEEATKVYRANWLKRHRQDPETMPFIAGPAVLFEDLIWP